MKGTFADDPIHSDEWLAAFHTQLTADLYDELCRFARKFDRKHGQDRLHTAIIKILDGRLSWNPDKMDLAGQLRREIGSDKRHDRDHDKKFIRVPADRSQLIVSDNHEHPEHLRLVLAALHELAADDAHVLLILSAWERHALLRRDVLRLTNLSNHEYEAACERLRRLRKRLPAGLRPRAGELPRTSRSRSPCSKRKNEGLEENHARASESSPFLNEETNHAEREPADDSHQAPR